MPIERRMSQCPPSRVGSWAINADTGRSMRMRVVVMVMVVVVACRGCRAVMRYPLFAGGVTLLNITFIDL